MLFDYDGTLTPIAARPEIATLSGKTRHSLAALNEMDRFVVGVVSGRGLNDLVAMVGIPGLVYAGNHGLEISGGSMHFVHPEAPDFESDLAGVSRLLEQELTGVPGILVDNKRLTLTVHFRASSESYATQVDETVVATAAPYVAAGKVKITRGKKVMEVRPNLDWGRVTPSIRFWRTAAITRYPCSSETTRLMKTGSLRSKMPAVWPSMSAHPGRTLRRYISWNRLLKLVRRWRCWSGWPSQTSSDDSLGQPGLFHLHQLIQAPLETRFGDEVGAQKGFQHNLGQLDADDLATDADHVHVVVFHALTG